MMGEARFMALGTKDEIGWLQGLMAPTAATTSFRYSCLWYSTHSIRSDPFTLSAYSNHSSCLRISNRGSTASVTQSHCPLLRF